jgi:hypothetical protein
MLNSYETKDDCKPCKRKQPATVRKGNVGLFTGILLALLPKCPFCLMAYSSTIMLCGKSGTLVSKHYFTSSASILITVLFCLMALSGIIFNYRDNRTKYAIGLAAAGSIFIIVSVSATGGLPLYYGGVFFVFVGVWLNSSLMYFVKKIKNNMGGNPSRDFKMIRQN